MEEIRWHIVHLKSLRCGRWHVDSQLNYMKFLKGCKDYGLKDQMTRAGVSVASNIAEGAERGSEAEFIRFLHIAKGSAAELRTQIYIANRIEILSNQLQTELVAELKSISSMMQGLIKSLKPKT